MEDTDDGKGSTVVPGENETNYTDSVRSKDELESVVVDHPSLANHGKPSVTDKPVHIYWIQS